MEGMKKLRFLLTIGFMSVALYHLYQAFFPAIPNHDIGKRHLALLLMNMAGAGLLLVDRPKLLLLLLPLMIHQIYENSTQLIISWKQFQVIHWPSVIVLIGMQLLAFYIVKRNKQDELSTENYTDRS
jgi:hypothetical protein